ncbi:MAG: serine hydrolase [Melioribacteraceae bacterium]|nr:serine hydrolase [Melioribacteraceae bacterium]
MKFPDKVRNKIENIIDEAEGTFAVSFLDLDNYENCISINSEERFHAASMMKVPVMIQIFRMIENDELSLSTKILLKNEFRSIVDGSSFSLDITRDSGEGMYGKIGSEVTVKDLLEDMIVHSGNLSANTLIETADAKVITESMRNLGAKNIEVLRGVEDIKAFENGLNNSTTSNDFLNIFKSIAINKNLSPDSCKKMIEVLLNQKINEMIPKGIPPEIKVAHKTGNIDGVEHDGGIVFLPDGKKYVLVILSKNLTENKYGLKIGAEISKTIYSFMNSL